MLYDSCVLVRLYFLTNQIVGATMLYDRCVPVMEVLSYNKAIAGATMLYDSSDPVRLYLMRNQGWCYHVV